MDDILYDVPYWLGKVKPPDRGSSKWLKIMGIHLSWTAEQKKAEVKQTLKLLKDMHGIRL